MDTLPKKLAVLTLGSNIDRQRHLPEAIRLLRRHHDIEVREVSEFFESASVGGPADAPDYYNAAMLVCSAFSPEELRAELREIENGLGRVRTEDPDEPRTIAIDIPYFDDIVESFEDSGLPDPDTLVAPHIPIPVAAVAPHLLTSVNVHTRR